MSKSNTARKLIHLLVCMCFGLATLTGLAWFRIADIERLLATTADRTMPQIQRINDIRLNILRMSLEARQAMLVETPQERQQTVDIIVGLRRQVGADLDLFGQAITTEQGARLFDKVKAAVTDFDASVAKIAPLLLQGESAAAFKTLQEHAVPARNRLLAAVDQQLQWQNELTAMRVAEAREVARSLVATLLLVSLALLAVFMVAGRRFLLGLRRDLGGEPAEVRAAVQRFASGDLATPVSLYAGDRGSALAAVEDMRQTLARLIGQISGGVQSVGSASREIAQGNADLSTRTEQQAGSLQQAAASMEQMSQSVSSNASAAQQANQLAETASQVAQRGGTVVGEVVATMSDISASSRRVADIVGVIDGIAFQTNILALNAAVEAARAGEQGRGFAVVASEVRSLARRSAEAAREIKSLIGQSVDKVEAGSRLVSDAGATMQDIVSQVTRVTELIAEITAASQNQSQDIGQVTQAVLHLDQATQKNAALVEQSAAAAETMQQQAELLAQAVAVFKVAPAPSR